MCFLHGVYDLSPSRCLLANERPARHRACSNGFHAGFTQRFDDLSRFEFDGKGCRQKNQKNSLGYLHKIGFLPKMHR
jgi:hypothetical protein